MSSLTYHLTMQTLKIMGIKKIFSNDPIDYEELRKQDQKEAPKSWRKKFFLLEIEIKQTRVINMAPKKGRVEGAHIVFIPGGAFISGPAKHHWDSLYKIVDDTGIGAWLIDYPKAPEADIQTINENIDEVYRLASSQFDPERIILIGDSVGANLITSLMQRLIARGQQLPKQIFLITPVFDASFTNPRIEEIEPNDPMLSKAGVASAKKMCAKDLDLKDPAISPLYGDFSGFPETMLFLGGRDIMYPDGLIAAEKMKAAGVNLELFDKPDMPHIYPLLPVMREAKQALTSIIKAIKGLVTVA